MNSSSRKEVRFTFLCNKEERDLINQIAEILDRAQGDAVRFLVVKAASELGIPAKNKQQSMEIKHAKTDE